MNKWLMNDVLASHFSAHTRIHVPDADMKVNLEPQGSAITDMDRDWESVQQKAQEVMRPLGVAWSQYILFKKGDLESLDGFQQADTLELSVLTLAHVQPCTLSLRSWSGKSNIEQRKKNILERSKEVQSLLSSIKELSWGSRRPPISQQLGTQLRQD